MKRIGILSVAFAAMLTVACGGDGRDHDATTQATPPAAGTPGAEGTAGETVDRGLQNWTEERLVSGMAEVRLGELASERAQNAEVKAFGRRMVQDHTKAGDELKQIASRHNMQAPMQLDDDHQGHIDRLSKLQGAEFDREYINLMVDNHEKTLNALEDRVEKQGDEPNVQFTAKQSDKPFESDLNRWAADAAPVVQQHLEQARQLKEKVDRRMTDNNR
jgi:putative membrane protein